MERSYLRAWKRYLTESSHRNRFAEGTMYSVYDHEREEWRHAVFVGHHSADDEYVFVTGGKKGGGDVIVVPAEYTETNTKRVKRAK